MKADQLDETQLMYKKKFFSIQNTLQFLFFEKNIFYYKQNHSALTDVKKFVKTNNDKLRELNDF